MPDEDQLYFHPADRPSPKRQSDTEFIMSRIARLPTRWELTKYAFVILAVGAIAIDDPVELGQQRGGLFIRKVKVHDPKMGSLTNGDEIRPEPARGPPDH